MQHGSPELYRRIRGILIANGQSLNKWCAENGVSRQWVEKALSGKRTGPAALKVVSQMTTVIKDLTE